MNHSDSQQQGDDAKVEVEQIWQQLLSLHETFHSARMTFCNADKHRQQMIVTQALRGEPNEVWFALDFLRDVLPDYLSQLTPQLLELAVIGGEMTSAMAAALLVEQKLATSEQVRIAFEYGCEQQADDELYRRVAALLDDLGFHEQLQSFLKHDCAVSTHSELVDLCSEYQHKIEMSDDDAHAAARKLLQQQWAAGLILQQEGVTYADARVILHDTCAEGSDADRHCQVQPYAETSLTSIMHYQSDPWVSVTELIDLRQVLADGRVLLAGEGAMGNEGFVALLDQAGDLIWSLYSWHSNPFESLQLIDDEVHAEDGYGLVWRFALKCPEKICIEQS